MRLLLAISLCLVCTSLASIAQAAGKYSRAGFALPQNETPSLLVIFSSLNVYAYDGEGQAIRSKAWEETAERNLSNYLTNSDLARKFHLTIVPAGTTAAAANREGFLDSVSSMIADLIFQVPQGTIIPNQPQKMPTPQQLRALRGIHQYKFSSQFISEHLSSAQSYDYVLFIQLHDGYRTTGQFFSDLATATALNLAKPDGSNLFVMKQTPRIGNLMLVDGETGDVEWFYGDGRLEGDLRTPEGARRKLQGIVRNLLSF